MMKRSVDFNDADLIKELERVLNEHAAQILKVSDIALTSYDIYSDGMIFEFQVRNTFRHIVKIKNGNELWSIVITNNHEYKTMAYIEYCPKCGRKL